MTSITVSGEDLLLIGSSRIFAATANTGAPVAARWGGDNPAVATVTPGGHVTAVGTGTVTIFADANGVRGTKQVRTLPDFTGEWSVYYQVTRCEATGVYVSWGCKYPPIGMSLKLVQTRESVAGEFIITDWGDYRFESDDLSGGVSAAGLLSFSATAESFDTHAELQNVRFSLSSDGRLTGSFEQLWFDEDGSGSVRYSCELTLTSRERR